MKKTAILLLSVLVVMVFTGCSLLSGKNSNTVVIAGKNFTEQDILVYMMKYVIEDQTKLKVETKAFLGGTSVVSQAIERGDIDIYPEYTGTALINLLGEPMISDPQAAYDKVKNIYKEKKQIIWLEPFGFNNTYTLTMRTDEAERLGINTISDLAAKADRLMLGCTQEFLERADGQKGLEEKYGFKFAAASGMDPGLTYAAVRDKKVDVIDGFSTDGRIVAFNLKVLEDDKKFFPPYYAAPIIREDTLKKHPEIADALKLLAGKLNETEMAKLNAKVDLEKQDPKAVAKEWLQSKGLIK
ncbi:glycine betaine ABC transporter substrate-binding protein [Pelosinus baikalensis]|uniref:Glycine/betaine ABC transporter substrate-binding protein n=1 Tax=Pelosinus baikalensis TaxID=2892015 RepID=A0ABS8HM46_9FIRM|nr:glycine betaine ABC transporter substrate-binding protein [Pelosinus baikalensis]MCC5464266.1 glycine/betaine ABC transporter substrate-binding protein [Pelosinus baikalensis]